MSIEIILGVGMFTVVILALVAFILVARSKLVASGDVNIEINGEKTITVAAGDKLLQTSPMPACSCPLPVVAVEPVPSASALSMTAAAPCCQRKNPTSTVAKPRRAGDSPARQLLSRI